MGMRILSAVLFVLLVVVSHSHAATLAEAPPLGLWVGSAGDSTSTVTLEITPSDDGWTARVDDAPVNVRINGDAIIISAPADQSFTGTFNAEDGTIVGRWRQPMSRLGYSVMETPVTLTEIDTQRWRAVIDIQPRPYRVFLDVFDTASGVTAVIRNPARNEILGATRFELISTGDKEWALTASRRGRVTEVSLRQVDGDTLSLEHFRFREGIALSPAKTTDARFYYSRLAEESRRYTPPEALDDGWSVVAADEAGFDRDRLDALVAELANSDVRAERPRMLHAMLVAHRGKLVFEEYFFGHTRETPHDTRSLAKVFGPILLGALRKTGADISPNARPIPGVLKMAGETLDDPRKADITLAQLMSFTSGLDCDAISGDSPGSEDNMWDQQEEPDFWRYTSRLPSLYPPGERYAYCSGSINLVGASLRETAGQSIIDTFDQLIAKPLAFSAYHWNLAPNGAAYLGGGVYMKPRDILKLGAMYAAGGVWNDTRVLSEDWVRESTTPVIDITPETTGLSEEAFNNNYFGGTQAYIWRGDAVRVGDKAYASYEATGNGGQIVLVVPELDLAVVFTGGNYRMGYVWGRWRNQLVGEFVIPALLP
ncbi:MAG: serine hydrolase domain-containing protein [Pseudomonadota bacterium]